MTNGESGEDNDVDFNRCSRNCAISVSRVQPPVVCCEDFDGSLFVVVVVPAARFLELVVATCQSCCNICNASRRALNSRPVSHVSNIPGPPRFGFWGVDGDLYR